MALYPTQSLEGLRFLGNTGALTIGDTLIEYSNIQGHDGAISDSGTGTIRRGNSDGIETIACMRVTRAAAQSTTHATWSQIAWTAWGYEYGGFTQSAGAVTVPVTGIYSLKGGGEWTANVTGRRLVLIYNVTSSIVIARQDAPTGGAGSFDQSTAGEINLNADDQVAFWVLQDSGGALNFSGAWFSIHLVRQTA